MNQRFKELAEQAGCKIMDDGEWYIPSAAGLEKVVYTSGVGLEKFAKLIVRECAEVIMGNEIDHPITGAVYDGDQAKAIKEHFGVEE